MGVDAQVMPIKNAAEFSAAFCVTCIELITWRGSCTDRSCNFNKNLFHAAHATDHMREAAIDISDFAGDATGQI